MENKHKDEILGAIADGQKKAESARIALEERMARVEADLKNNKRIVSLPGVNEGKEKFSWLRAAKGILTGDWRGCGYEREVFQQTHKRADRALDSGTDSAGGYLVPQEAAAPFAEKLYANMITKTLGARVMDGLKGSPVPVPGMSASATAYWVGSNSPITVSQPSFRRRELQNRKVAAICALDNELLKMAIPSAEQIVADDLAQVCGLAFDLAAMYGSGNGEPLGILYDDEIAGSINNASAGVVIGGNGGDFTFAKASELIGIVEDNNADKGKLGFATHPAIRRKLKTEFVDGSTYALPPILSNAQLAEVLGAPMEATTQLPNTLVKGGSSDCAPVIYGNWEDLLLGMWGGIELSKSDAATDGTSHAFVLDQTWLRVTMICDSIARRPESFAACVDARTNE